MKNSGKTPPEIKTLTGLVGFFDILGYGKLIENNRIEDVVSLINRAFDNVRMWQKSSRDANKPKRGPYKVIFSDSILLDMPFDEQANEKDKSEAVFPFLLFCQLVMWTMFEQGLPCRGGVADGDYYIKRQGVLLVGKPIIEAHKLSKEVNFAGCVLSAKVGAMVPNNNIPVYVNWDSKGDGQQMTLLKYFGKLPNLSEVERQFSAHKKPIVDDRVQQKIKLTQEFISFQSTFRT